MITKGPGSAGMPIDLELTNIGARGKISAASLGELNDRTNTTLGAAASFTGANQPVLISAAAAAVGTAATAGVTFGRKFGAMVFADQAGTLKFQGSADGGTNFDTIGAGTAIAASVAQCVQQDMLGAIFGRVVYTNGGTIQGAFRLSAMNAGLA